MEPELRARSGPRWRSLLPGHLPFRRMIEVQAAHAAGDALVAIALVDTLFFSVPLGEARDKAALYLLLTMAPFALLSPLVGPLLDRFEGSYRLAMIASAFGRGVLALLLSTRTDRPALYPLAFGLLVLSRVHGVSRSAYVPSVLPEGRSLMWGNAWLAIVSVTVGAVAALPGAFVNRVLGSSWTLKIAMVVFAAGSVAALHLPTARVSYRRGQRLGRVRSHLTPRLLAGGVGAASSRAVVGFLAFMLAFVLRDEGETGAGFVAVLVAAGVGGLAGALLAPQLRRIMKESLLMLGALAGTGAAALALAPRFGVGPAALVAGVTGLAAASARLAFDSILQTDAPEIARGRAFARYETIFQAFWVGGAGLAVAIPFSFASGLRTMAAMCFAGAAGAIWRYLYPQTRRERRAAAEAEDEEFDG